jgi:hypothetical protein
MYIYLVKKHSIEDLAKRIKDRQVITKQQVLRESKLPCPSIFSNLVSPLTDWASAGQGK